jgi:hypothetical protein
VPRIANAITNEAKARECFEVWGQYRYTERLKSDQIRPRWEELSKDRTERDLSHTPILSQGVQGRASKPPGRQPHVGNMPCLCVCVCVCVCTGGNKGGQGQPLG